MKQFGFLTAACLAITALAGCGGAGVPSMAPATGNARPNAVGTIIVCYYSQECSYTEAVVGYSGPVDAPAFEFTNSASAAITNATFTIEKNKKNSALKDTYTIGTIKAGASVVVIPGFSNDGKKRSNTHLFFYYAGTPRDTSEVGPDADAIKFSFKGKSAGNPVASGMILTGKTAGESNDKTVSKINFLGGPSNADGPCNDCVGPYAIATISSVK